MGETGSGKTTQLPQFIQDARLINGQIGVTQVRCSFSRWVINYYYGRYHEIPPKALYLP